VPQPCGKPVRRCARRRGRTRLGSLDAPLTARQDAHQLRHVAPLKVIVGAAGLFTVVFIHAGVATATAVIFIGLAITPRRHLSLCHLRRHRKLRRCRVRRCGCRGAHQVCCALHEEGVAAIVVAHAAAAAAATAAAAARTPSAAPGEVSVNAAFILLIFIGSTKLTSPFAALL
jgi:hypothetical protein